MFNNDNVKYLHSPLILSDNILVRVNDALVQTLNSYLKLPRIVLVLIERDFRKLGESNEAIEHCVFSLLTQFYRIIEGRKDDLPAKSFRATEPTFLFIKPVPLADTLDILGKDKQLGRGFNRAMDIYARNF